MIETYSKDEFLNPIVEKFIESTDRVVDILGDFGNQVTLHDNFSQLLMHVQPGFMQHLRSCQLLADCILFFSVGMICRSLFDLEITLSCINRLDADKKIKAMQTYLVPQR